MEDQESAPMVRAIGLPPIAITAVTWRYQGERDAADRAYCLRFAVDVAPEPMVAPGGALAYPVPNEEHRP